VSLFRRRKVAETDQSTTDRSTTDPSTGAVPAESTDETVADVEESSEISEVSVSEPYDRSNGPWDVSELPEDAEGPERLVLGGVQLVGRQGMELRFEVEEANQRVIAVTIGMNGSTVQLQTFAAPRTSGVWDEIRAEIAAAVVAQGGSADEQDGALGRELMCRLPVRTEDGRTAHQPTRFAGIDGPRWFLRAVFSGPAAHDAAAAQELESVVRDVAVVRGDEAMAPRELIPLALPPQPEAPAAEAAPQTPQDDLKPFERGPEITEVR